MVVHQIILERLIVAVGMATFLTSGCGAPMTSKSHPKPNPEGAPNQVLASSLRDISQSDAKSIVARELGVNKLGITADQLRSTPNPKGDGEFVYVEQTRFSGVERYVLWLVIDGEAYPLNGATKGSVTPGLLWPREAPQGTWNRTKLDMYMATEAIEIVFGEGGTRD